MKSANKQVRLGFVKSLDTKAKTVLAHVSTYQWDRTNEKFSKGAWNLENFLKNPVVLWGHDQNQPPIAKAINIIEDEMGLLAETKFDEGSERAMEIFGLYERGFLNAFSVGFIPKKWAFEGIEGTSEKGLVYQEAELLEYSAVSVPANPGAVLSRSMGEMVIKTLGDGFLTEIKSPVDGFLVNPVKFNEGPSGLLDPAINQTETIASNSDSAIVTFKSESPIESLDNLLLIAKAAKGSKLDKTKVDMIGHAVTLFQEIIAENSDSVKREDFNTLKSAVENLSEVVKSLYPDTSEVVRRIMAQVDKALNSRVA